MVIPVGSLVNAGAIAAGSVVGLALGRFIPERVKNLVFQGFGLCTLVIGLNMAQASDNLTIVVFSIALGAITGELLNLEKILENAGHIAKRVLASNDSRFTEGLITSSLIFSVGAMAIIGGFDEGLRGDRTTLITKSALDGFTSIILAATYGFGVFWSWVVVFIYQATITIFAEFLRPFLSDHMVNELTATGGILIMAISFNFLGVKRIPLSNLLPAMLYAVFLARCF